jgi:hypothetical protein
MQMSVFQDIKDPYAAELRILSGATMVALGLLREGGLVGISQGLLAK